MAEHEKLDAAVFWDASYNSRLDGARQLKGTDYYYLDWHVWPLIGRAMYEEAQQFNQAELLKDFTTPLKVITAGNNVQYKSRKQNYELAQGPKSYHEIEGAGHIFDEEGKAQELFEESLKWLKKYS